MMMTISFFNSPEGINCAVPTQHVTIETAVSIIKSDKFKDKIISLRDSSVDKKKALKDKLPYFTFGGKFSYRNTANILEGSGIIVLDIDHVKNVNSLKDQIQNNEYTYFVFISPSGDGLKIGIKIPLTNSNVEYKSYWEAAAELYETPVDEKAKDITRACFVSYDPQIYFNPDSKIFTERKQIIVTAFTMMDIDPDVIDIMCSEWKEGIRQELALYLSAVLRQKGYGINSVTSTIKQICSRCQDKDISEREGAIYSTFSKDETEIKGHMGLKNLMSEDMYKLLLLALNEKTQRETKRYELKNITSHIPLYSVLSDALGLYGERYNILRKLMWYSLVGNSIKSDERYIDFSGTQFDTRESIVVFAPSGSGKNDINRVMVEGSPFTHDKSQITSLHPEQLIGKVVTIKNEETKVKEKKEIKGYFNEDILIMDESRDFFQPTNNAVQKQVYNDLKKYFCIALNPMGTNLVVKRLTEHTREESLKYYPKCTCCFLSQPVKISSESIESGFMRRFTFIEVRGKEERIDIYAKRTVGKSKMEFTNNLSNYMSNLSTGEQVWSFENISSELIKYSNLLCEYGMSVSEKSAAFITEIYEQSMYDKLLKYSSIVAVYRRGEKRITPSDVKVAYMDLFEIFTSTFECLTDHAEDFYAYDMKFSELTLLRWLDNRKAHSAEKSSIDVKTVVEQISDLTSVQYRQAGEYFSRLQKNGYVQVAHGKTKGKVFLTEKAIEKIRIGNRKVTEDFYTEYLMICEETKNEK